MVDWDRITLIRYPKAPKSVPKEGLYMRGRNDPVTGVTGVTGAPSRNPKQHHTVSHQNQEQS